MSALLAILLTAGIVTYSVRLVIRHAQGLDGLLHVASIIIFSSTAIFMFIAAMISQVNPGGFSGLMVTILWAAPMFGLGYAAWNHPESVGPPLWAIIGLIVGLDLFYIFFYESLDGFSTSNGPALAHFAFLAVLGIYATKKPLDGGRMILFFSIVCTLLTALAVGGFEDAAAMLLLGAIPAMVAGTLFFIVGTQQDPTNIDEAAI